MNDILLLGAPALEVLPLTLSLVTNGDVFFWTFHDSIMGELSETVMRNPTFPSLSSSLMSFIDDSGRTCPTGYTVLT